MRKKTVTLLILVILLVLSLLPVLPDPFHSEGNVCFWRWVWREIYELIYGEVG